MNMLSIFLCIVVGVALPLSSSSEQLIGGISPLTESDITTNDSNGINLVSLINRQLVATTANMNELPLKYYAYVCGTKQVVAGMRYHVQYIACSMDNSNDGCNYEIPPSKCNSTFWIQPWLLNGFPMSDDKANCTFISESSYETVSECTLQQPAHTRINTASPTVSMEKSQLYNKETKSKFDKFIDDYQKTYSKDPTSQEYFQRYKNFAKNLIIAQSFNILERGTAKYDVTKFMDYSAEEFKSYCAPGLTESKFDLRQVHSDEVNPLVLPDSFDWREHGAVSKVKNQGQCGSCWAFSTTGNVEGQWFLKKKKLISLSEQELVDCDSIDDGCNGGLPSNAYKAIEKLGGLESEADYPYKESANHHCKFERSEVRVYINDSVSLPTDENKLAQWLVPNGPISIGINANAMQYYTGGISHPWKILCRPSSLDHGVLIVGFGIENETPFWIIKNSWGADWGEAGYYRIYRGDGSCGLNKVPTSSIVD